MRVRDWRTNGGLDVLAHLAARDGALDPSVARAVFEARGVLLAAAARLAADRRSGEQAKLLRSLRRAARRRARRRRRAGTGLRVLRRARRSGRQPRVLADHELDPRSVPGRGASVFRPIVGAAPSSRRCTRARPRAVGERDAARGRGGRGASSPPRRRSACWGGCRDRARGVDLRGGRRRRRRSGAAAAAGLGDRRGGRVRALAGRRPAAESSWRCGRCSYDRRGHAEGLRRRARLRALRGRAGCACCGASGRRRTRCARPLPGATGAMPARKR